MLLSVHPRSLFHAHSHFWASDYLFPPSRSFFITSAQAAAALHGIQPSAHRLQWGQTATANAAALHTTGAKMRNKLEAAAALAVAWMIIFPSRQTIRAHLAMMVTAPNPTTALQGLIARTAAPAEVRLHVLAGTGILPVAHLAAANRGATRALLLRLAAKTWG